MRLVPKDFYFDNIWDDFFPSISKNDMKCDIYEKDSTYFIEMDAPGFEKNDIKVEENNGYLTISAEKTDEVNDENKKYIRRERNTSKYQRSFYLGDIDKENIKAEFKDGLLKISIPKVKEIETKKTIEIE